MSKPSPKITKRLVWHARMLMAKHNIRSVSALVIRLNEIGISISIAQLGRLIDGKNKLWNQEVVEGLLVIFDCSLSDMIETVVETNP